MEETRKEFIKEFKMELWTSWEGTKVGHLLKANSKELVEDNMNCKELSKEFMEKSVNEMRFFVLSF